MVEDGITKGVVGVDIGAKGGVSIVSLDGSEYETFKMPETTVEIAMLFEELDIRWNIIAYWLEDVHSIHGASAKSNFNFGKNLGEIRGIVATYRKRMEKVQPKIWQKEFGIAPKSTKKDIARVCLELFPNAQIRGVRGGLLDGLSDSLLIAEYGRRKI